MILVMTIVRERITKESNKSKLVYILGLKSPNMYFLLNTVYTTELVWIHSL